jgi:hypothetical protein
MACSRLAGVDKSVVRVRFRRGPDLEIGRRELARLDWRIYRSRNWMLRPVSKALAESEKTGEWRAPAAIEHLLQDTASDPTDPLRALWERLRDGDGFPEDERESVVYIDYGDEQFLAEDARRLREEFEAALHRQLDNVRVMSNASGGLRIAGTGPLTPHDLEALSTVAVTLGRVAVDVGRDALVAAITAAASEALRRRLRSVRGTEKKEKVVAIVDSEGEVLSRVVVTDDSP